MKYIYSIELIGLLAGFLGISLGMAIGFAKEYVRDSKNKDVMKKIVMAQAICQENMLDFIPNRIKKGN